MLFFNIVGACYIIVEGNSSMWVAWYKNRNCKFNVIEKEVSPLSASMCMVPCSINLIGISKLEKQKKNIVNYYHSQYFSFFMS
jgi:hypothetical protein